MGKGADRRNQTKKEPQKSFSRFDELEHDEYQVFIVGLDVLRKKRRTPAASRRLVRTLPGNHAKIVADEHASSLADCTAELLPIALNNVMGARNQR